jgi:hypothetical protein
MTEAKRPSASDNTQLCAADERAPDGGPASSRRSPIKGLQLAVALSTPVLQSTTVSIENYTADTVTAKYVGLPGNQPSINKNFLAIWQDSVIPWSTPPDASKVIPLNRPTGTVTLSGLTITMNTYIVGYGVGPGSSTICASAILSAGGLRGAPSSIQLGLVYVGTDTVVVNYATLSGYLPAKNHNWIGLWRGYASPYETTAPAGSVQIPTDVTSASVAIDGVAIAINSPYTLIYFMGDPENQKTNTLAAAILTFETAGLLSQSTR